MTIEKFGRLPAWFVKSGAWKRLSWNEMAVLGVLVVVQDNNTHETWIKRADLSDYSNVCKSSVSSATQGLVHVGVISKKRRGNRVVYRIEMVAPEWVTDTGKFLDLKRGVSPKPSDIAREQGTGRFSRGIRT